MQEKCSSAGSSRSYHMHSGKVPRLAVAERFFSGTSAIPGRSGRHSGAGYSGCLDKVPNKGSRAFQVGYDSNAMASQCIRPWYNRQMLPRAHNNI